MKEWLIAITEHAVLVINAMALIVIAFGTLQAFIGSLRLALSSDYKEGRGILQRFGRWLVAGLTFQLAADILQTSVAPSWDELGKLAAIAIIRTALNYFLEHDLQNFDGAAGQEKEAG
jgi:uncharacterized membrane protein